MLLFQVISEVAVDLRNDNLIETKGVPLPLMIFSSTGQAFKVHVVSNRYPKLWFFSAQYT